MDPGSPLRSVRDDPRFYDVVLAKCASGSSVFAQPISVFFSLSPASFTEA